MRVLPRSARMCPSGISLSRFLPFCAHRPTKTLSHRHERPEYYSIHCRHSRNPFVVIAGAAGRGLADDRPIELRPPPTLTYKRNCKHCEFCVARVPSPSNACCHPRSRKNIPNSLRRSASSPNVSLRSLGFVLNRTTRAIKQLNLTIVALPSPICHYQLSR